MHEKDLFLKIKKGDIFAFEKLFKTYYKNLCFFAEHYVREKSMAEEIVGNFFLNFWEKRRYIDIKGSVKSYLYTSIHNRCLKYLEHLKVMKKYRDYAHAMLKNKELLMPLSDSYPLANLVSKEIVKDIEKAIDELPDKCKEVFCLSRFEEMSYEDISTKLEISINTVRTQMKRALKKLRDSLKDYLPLFILLFFNKIFIFFFIKNYVNWIW